MVYSVASRPFCCCSSRRTLYRLDEPPCGQPQSEANIIMAEDEGAGNVQENATGAAAASRCELNILLLSEVTTRLTWPRKMLRLTRIRRTTNRELSEAIKAVTLHLMICRRIGTANYDSSITSSIRNYK